MTRGAWLRSALVAASLVIAGMGWFVAARARGARAPLPTVPTRDERAEVPGLRGEVETAGGARLFARITRLHAEPERQAFDARALQRRFQLDAGEPFACNLRLLRATKNADTAIDLRGLTIVDAAGPALIALRRLDPPTATNSAPIDPLATLLAPPLEPLASGFEVCVVLWGREPRAGARLILGHETEVALVPVSLQKSQIETALARIGVPRAATHVGDER